MRWFSRNWLQIGTHCAALAPLALLIWDFSQNNLSVNPIQDLTLRTGTYALVLLLLSLACTPIDLLFGFKPVLALRKPLGLYAFLYVSLHAAIFVGLDYGFDWELIQQAIVEKRYVLAGLAALLLLLPLAITSTRGWMQRLGKNWKRLHRLVYVAALLAVIHYLWLVKSDIRLPLLYGALLLGLLALRLPPLRQPLRRWRDRLRGRSQAAAAAATRRTAPPIGEPES